MQRIPEAVHLTGRQRLRVRGLVLGEDLTNRAVVEPGVGLFVLGVSPDVVDQNGAELLALLRGQRLVDLRNGPGHFLEC